MTGVMKGIDELLRYQLQQESNDELVETAMKAYALAGDNILKLDEFKEELVQQHITVAIAKQELTGAKKAVVGTRKALVGTKKVLADTKKALATKEASIKKRNAAGANAKAKIYQPKKNKVSKVYGTLKSANGGKNPALKVLLDELERVCPTENWATDTITDWHKKLNKGLLL